MRDAMPQLHLEGRIGVNTGEVLSGTEERLATGDAVNVAARLEQAAEPGEVLIGAHTLALVGAAVEVGEARLLELKGKTEPVAAHPLLAVREVAERSHGSRFVGREHELQQLVDAWDRALAGSRCEMITVVGDPGVGKSRLVAEALAQVDADVVRGRCLSYGEGITYWPVVEVVKQVDALPTDEAADAIRSLLGEGEALSSTDEIAWAFRKLLEEQAPLVVCFDDIQ
jgi:AAA ATPase domain/Adenylate and Guanylate cyclase catalytic domain